VIRSRDLLAEAAAGMLQRPGRSALTMMGTVLGVGTFIAIIGLTSTAGGQISKRFSVLQATQVVVQDAAAAEATRPTLSFPDDAERRLGRLNGVEAAGLHWPLAPAPVLSSRPGAVAEPVSGIEVHAAGPGVFPAAGVRIQAGVSYNTWHDEHHQAVAVLGAVAARKLGISHLENGPAVWIDGSPYTVVGVVDTSERLPGLLMSVLIPPRTALDHFGPPSPEHPAQVLVRTALGAAGTIARQAPLSLRPENPMSLEAQAPPDPRTLRDTVSSDLDVLFLALAGIAVFIGALGIANTTMVAVLERSSEIGLRRALGACRRHIAGQFLLESTGLGLLGGLVGSSLGVVTVVGVAVQRSWTPVLDPVLAVAGPGVGAVVGLLAGAYPALRAASLDPALSLRR